MDITIEEVHVDKIINLRHRVLCEGLPIETARFPGDEAPDARHFAAVMIDGKRVVCCVSFMRVPYLTSPAWQLRGMATDPDFQGQGIGRKLLAVSEQAIVRSSDIRLFWCNARLSAVRFYEKSGWYCVSAQFEIPGAGSHCRMITL